MDYTIINNTTLSNLIQFSEIFVIKLRAINNLNKNTGKMIRKSPYLEENYTVISQMTGKLGSEVNESLECKSEIEIEDSTASVFEDSQNIFKLANQDLTTKRVVENELSVFGI